MAEQEVFITPEERLAELGDIILASVLHTDDESLARRRTLYGNLPVSSFSNENFVIYSVLYNFRDKGITPDNEFMKLYLMRNTKFFRENQSKIDLTDYGDEEDPYVGYVASVLKQYTRLQGLDIDEEDFNLCIEKYKNEYSSIEWNKALSVSKQILYDGVQVGRKFFQGFSDSVAYVKKSSADIQNMLDSSIGDGFIDSNKEGIIDTDEARAEKIGDFDLINELNEYLGGVYTGQLYNVVAPTKGGKSKFCTRLAHTMLVKYGTDISVWAVEGGYKEWWAQLRAIHFEYMFIRNMSEDMRVAPLSQEDIIYGRYPSEDMRRLEETSRLDLFTNPNYGVANMINRPFKLESFADDIDTSIKLNNSRALFIDYPQLIESDSSKISLSEMVKAVYKTLLRMTKARNMACINPAQYTQDFIKQMGSYKGESSPETRTAGGESSEIIRSADYNIALYASLDDLARNQMTVLSMPSRKSKSFPSFDMYADLCSCVFSSIEED